MCVFYVLNLCSVSFLPRFSLTDPTSSYSLGYVSCFHTVVQKQQHLEQPLVFATGFSVTGNPGIEWTYCNSTPATNTLTYTYKRAQRHEKEQQQGGKQVYDNILPPANPLASVQHCPEPNRRVLTYNMKLSAVYALLLITHSGSVIGRIRAQTAPPEGTHLWHINLEGRGWTWPNLMTQALRAQPVSSWDICGIQWLHHLQIWRHLYWHIWLNV